MMLLLQNLLLVVLLLSQQLLAADPNADYQVATTSEVVVWEEVTASAPWGARGYLSNVVFNNSMWVMGGFKSWGSLRYMNDVWSSSDGASWTLATLEEAWVDRATHTCVVYNDPMWMLGGSRTYHGYNLNDVWSSSDGLASWTRIHQVAPWSARGGHTSVVFNDRMWVIGGFSTGYLSDVWQSIPITSQPTHTPTGEPSAPSGVPTGEPSGEPTDVPTGKPSAPSGFLTACLVNHLRHLVFLLVNHLRHLVCPLVNHLRHLVNPLVNHLRHLVNPLVYPLESHQKRPVLFLLHPQPHFAHLVLSTRKAAL
jgi:hypothetical protein